MNRNDVVGWLKTIAGFANTNGATCEEIIEMSIKSKKTQYDILHSDEKYDASNFKDLYELYKQHISRLIRRW